MTELYAGGHSIASKKNGIRLLADYEYMLGDVCATNQMALVMKRLMLFIEPTSAQLNIFSQFTLPRLGSFILAGLVNQRKDWNARVFIEGRQRFDLQAWVAEHGQPEAVGISTITATARRGYALADECRARGIPVILGGPHV